MDKQQRWWYLDRERLQPGLEIANGPCTLDLPPFMKVIDGELGTYHAQMIACSECAALLDPGESCDHLAFDGGVPARVRVLHTGFISIYWRLFSKAEQAVRP